MLMYGKLQYHVGIANQQMTQKLQHSQHPVFMNTPAQTAMYIKRTFKK